MLLDLAPIRSEPDSPLVLLLLAAAGLLLLALVWRWRRGRRSED